MDSIRDSKFNRDKRHKNVREMFKMLCEAHLRTFLSLFNPTATYNYLAGVPSDLKALSSPSYNHITSMACIDRVEQPVDEARWHFE